MKTFTLATVAALGLALAVPALAQPSDVGNMAYPNPANTPQGNFARAPTSGRDVGNMAERAPDRPGYTTRSYGRRPAGQTPTDVGSMAFPDPVAQGQLPAVRQ